MIRPVTQQLLPLYNKACHFEHVLGSRSLTACRLYGLEHPAQEFFVSQDASGNVDAALHLNGDVLTVTGSTGPALEELAEMIRANGITEVDTTEQQALELQKLLGGEIESSFYMEYPAKVPPRHIPADIELTRDSMAVFKVLQQSHEYYLTHLVYEPWSKDLETRWDNDITRTVLLTVDGKPVGCGSMLSSDDEAGAIAEVAVIPEYRGHGYGSAISAWLTDYILQMGKKPVLISGYDEVAQLYRQIGFEETGRWGELYL